MAGALNNSAALIRVPEKPLGKQGTCIRAKNRLGPQKVGLGRGKKVEAFSRQKRKGGWEREKVLEKKKRHEDGLLLNKTHKVTSFFPVLEKNATSASECGGAGARGGATTTDDSPLTSHSQPSSTNNTASKKNL
ncbi:hypothetical protein HELRODRAFT_164049 [Helobdella robusta]|uniref:Uncharacterized protein n=1 Tax=Helobdella robusta TaxID=6412 RepID=T1EUT9_HELRO|nr:hypothetical protein HELRODRAFT_164049 [Helobdella robusta]ESN94244.1 hypothetical protein HELRODRAFT_164049 [Helobdella robusta]